MEGTRDDWIRFESNQKRTDMKGAEKRRLDLKRKQSERMGKEMKRFDLKAKR